MLQLYDTASLTDFYPRSPCGERPNNVLPAYAACGISIHALLAESDGKLTSASGLAVVFLSTLSLRRATGAVVACRAVSHFYPRSPCGERQFLRGIYHFTNDISIHALLAESDLPLMRCILFYYYFYPRSPCGERRCCSLRE